MKQDLLLSKMDEWQALMEEGEYRHAVAVYEESIDEIGLVYTDQVLVLTATNQLATALLFAGSMGAAAERFKQMLTMCRPSERKSIAKWIERTVDHYVILFGGDKDAVLGHLIGSGPDHA